MDSDYNAAHKKNSGSGIDDDGEIEFPPSAPVLALDGSGCEIEYDPRFGFVLYGPDGLMLTILSTTAAKQLVAYVEKWK